MSHVGHAGALLLAWMLVLTPLPATADSDLPSTAALHALLEDAIAQEGPPALVVAVVRTGRPPRFLAAGAADLRSGRPADADTLFPVGSLSKPVTAALLLRQVGAGRLALDAPVNRYLPERQWLRDDRGRPASSTLRQLLTHSSGLPLTLPGIGLPWRSDPGSASELLDRGLELVHPAGARIVYSNAGYAVLGHILAAVDGENLPEHADRVLFGPAGMPSSQFRPPVDPALAARATRTYERSAGQLVAIAPRRFAGFAPAAGLWTSARDLAHFATLLLDPDDPVRRTVFADAPLVELFEPAVRPHPDADPARSLGLVVGTFRGHRAAWHNGIRRGASARLVLLPDDGMAVVVLANGRDVDTVTRVARRLLAALLGLPIDEPAPVPIPEARAARLVGHYRIDDAIPGELAPIASLFELRITRASPALRARVLPVGERLGIVAHEDGELRVAGGSQDGARVVEDGNTLHLGFLRAERIPRWRAGTTLLTAIAAITLLTAALLTARLIHNRRQPPTPGKRP